MIVVRCELGSVERIRIEEADSFEIQGEMLLVFKGREPIAQFRHWAYVMKLENDPAQEEQIPLSSSARVVITPPRPLNLGAPTKPMVTTP